MDKIICNQDEGENNLLTCKVLRQKISLKFKKILEISEKQYLKHLALPLPQFASFYTGKCVYIAFDFLIIMKLLRIFSNVLVGARETQNFHPRIFAGSVG